VELGGGNPALVLSLIHRCKNHFDRWFGVTADQVRSLESSLQAPAGQG